MLFSLAERGHHWGSWSQFQRIVLLWRLGRPPGTADYFNRWPETWPESFTAKTVVLSKACLLQFVCAQTCGGLEALQSSSNSQDTLRICYRVVVDWTYSFHGYLTHSLGWKSLLTQKKQSIKVTRWCIYKGKWTGKTINLTHQDLKSRSIFKVTFQW